MNKEEIDQAESIFKKSIALLEIGENYLMQPYHGGWMIFVYKDGVSGPVKTLYGPTRYDILKKEEDYKNNVPY